MRKQLKSLMTGLLLAAVALPVHAQRGDKKGEEQPERWKEWKVPPSPVVAPDDSLKSLKVADGFKVELVAAEPLVEDPVAITWDDAGRLWAVEMRGYMPNVDGDGEDVRNGRVVVLQDTDHDGRMDTSTVFLDGLQMPRTIAMVPGGVLIAEPPFLWLCRDTDGDLKCDSKEKVDEAYGKQEPVEHTDNGMVFCLDNWIYNAKSNRRMQFRDGKLIAEATSFRGQWGIAQDDYGRLYSNTNSSYLHADLVPDSYFQRNPGLGSFGINSKVVGYGTVFPARVTPGVNRGYRKDTLDDDGMLKSITAVSGMAIYRGDQYPASYRGAAFIPEPAGNCVTLHYVDSPDGVNLKGRRAYEKAEFLTSTDERFRPVNCEVGPDGCLYVIDMYRGILQHKAYVTTYLRKQILERGLDKPLGLGRIYRVVSTAKPVNNQPAVAAGATPDQLVALLESENGWQQDTAQRLLVQTGAKAAIPALRRLAMSSANPLARIHALWALNGLGEAVDGDTAGAALAHADPMVRVAGLRTAEPLLRAGDQTVLAALPKLATDDSAAVRLQLAFSVGEAFPRPRALDAAVELLKKDPGNDQIRLALLSGSARHELELYGALAAAGSLKKIDKNTGTLLTMLASSAFQQRNPGLTAMLLETAAAAPADQSKALLQGILDADKKHPKALRLTTEPKAFAALAANPPKDLAATVKEIRTRVAWGADQATDNGPNAETTAILKRGQSVYEAVCMACHQPTGNGLPGLAPPLNGSEWVTGPSGRVVRVIFDGLAGEITVKGEKWNMLMPPHRENPLLDDAKVADLVSYIRNAWDNEASLVTADTVAAIRKSTASRTSMWSEADLKKVKE